jgi:hypothetical protein
MPDFPAGDREMRKAKTEIFSIFGQCEAAAAQSMIDKGELTKIEYADIPDTARTNDAGQRAYFAVVVPASKLRAFNLLCEAMRA